MTTKRKDPGKTPMVSVIMPAYHTARHIAAALDSVLAQTFSDYEIIVVNDGSPDTEELEQVLAPYRGSITYLKQDNRGVGGARNTGIRAARGRYVALLDSDDVWEPGYLAAQVAELERDPRIEVIYPNALFFGDSPLAGKTWMELYPPEGEITFARLATEQCHIFYGSTARREAVLRAGLFDESLRSSEDFDLWLRIVHQGGRIAYNREVLTRYRKRRGSLSDDPVWMWESYLKVLTKVERTMELPPGNREVVARQCERIRAMVHLYRGKKAFFRGDPQAAIGHLAEANSVFRSRKLALAGLLLRFTPRLLQRAYDFRDRFILRMSTKI